MIEQSLMNKRLGFRVRQLRESFHDTREHFAEICSISPHYLGEIEAGKKMPGSYILAKIAVALGVSADYLLFGGDISTDPTPLYEILSNLSPKEMDYARELLLLFVKKSVDETRAPHSSEE